MPFASPPAWSRSVRASVSAFAVAVITAAAGLLALSGPAHAAGTQCQATYTVTNDWGSGFQASVAITNIGAPWTSWTLGYSYTGNQAVSSGWNGSWTQSGKNVTVSSLSWNANVGTGATVTPAAVFTYSGSNPAPTSRRQQASR